MNSALHFAKSLTLGTDQTIGIYTSIKRIIGTFYTVGTSRDLSLHYDRLIDY